MMLWTMVLATAHAQQWQSPILQAFSLRADNSALQDGYCNKVNSLLFGRVTGLNVVDNRDYHEFDRARIYTEVTLEVLWQFKTGAQAKGTSVTISWDGGRIGEDSVSNSDLPGPVPPIGRTLKLALVYPETESGVNFATLQPAIVVNHRIVVSSNNGTEEFRSGGVVTTWDGPSWQAAYDEWCPTDPGGTP